MAIHIYSQKSNAWRDAYNPLRGMSLPKMLSCLMSASVGSTWIKGMNGAIEGGEAVMTSGVDIRFLLRKDTTTGPHNDDVFIGDRVMENGHLTQNGNTFTLDCIEYGGDHYHVEGSKWPGTGDDGATWTSGNTVTWAGKGTLRLYLTWREKR